MHVDLMAVVRKIGAWAKAQLKQREGLAFVTDDPGMRHGRATPRAAGCNPAVCDRAACPAYMRAGAHKLFRGELHKLGRASCQNLTGQIDDLRSGFGEWLVKERCEAAAPQPEPQPIRAPHSPSQPFTASHSPSQPRTVPHSPAQPPSPAQPRVHPHVPP